MADPTVDILMATYNGEQYIAEQIESIQCQTDKNWRLSISDDCSTDATLDVVRSYAAKDQRIRIVSQGIRHGGAKENFFSLLKYSDAPYFMFCDQDDVWLPGKLEDELAAIHAEENECEKKDPIAVYTDMRVVGEDLKELAPSFLDLARKRGMCGSLRQFLSISGAAGCTMLGNDVLRNIIAGTDCSAALMHDWWICIVAASCGKLVYVDRPTVLYRQHGNNEIGAESYSFWDRVVNFRDSRRKYWATCEQACAILQQYGDVMTDGGRELVSSYATQLHSNFRDSMKNLSSHGLLKDDIGRRAAQVLTIFLGIPKDME